jgi:hypothetical protein
MRNIFKALLLAGVWVGATTGLVWFIDTHVFDIPTAAALIVGMISGLFCGETCYKIAQDR